MTEEIRIIKSRISDDYEISIEDLIRLSKCQLNSLTYCTKCLNQSLENIKAEVKKKTIIRYYKCQKCGFKEEYHSTHFFKKPTGREIQNYILKATEIHWKDLKIKDPEKYKQQSIGRIETYKEIFDLIDGKKKF